jgi:hypothetical protein
VSNPFINYNYANNTHVFGECSNLEDQNFEGNFEEDSFIAHNEFPKHLLDEYISMSSNSILSKSIIIHIIYSYLILPYS